MNKIGLFGGTFDPFHLGHAAIINSALSFGLDKIIVVPTGVPPHKPATGLSKAVDRFAMARLGIREIKGAEVSDFEIKKEGPSYTVDTVLHFKKLYDKSRLYFIVGDDAYDKIDTWREPARLFKLCTFLVYNRSGLEIRPPAAALDGERVLISSSEIRERVRRGEDIRDMLPGGVFEYIVKNKLYGGIN